MSATIHLLRQRLRVTSHPCPGCRDPIWTRWHGNRIVGTPRMVCVRCTALRAQPADDLDVWLHHPEQRWHDPHAGKLWRLPPSPLKALRQRRNQTQRAVARAIGVAPSLLCRWETGSLDLPLSRAMVRLERRYGYSRQQLRQAMARWKSQVLHQVHPNIIPWWIHGR